MLEAFSANTASTTTDKSADEEAGENRKVDVPGEKVTSYEERVDLNSDFPVNVGAVGDADTGEMAEIVATIDAVDLSTCNMA